MNMRTSIEIPDYLFKKLKIKVVESLRNKGKEYKNSIIDKMREDLSM